MVEGHKIFFRTGIGEKLWATTCSNVTFEVDEIDLAHKRGWSVMARGAAREVSFDQQPEIAGHADTAAPVPWAPGEHDHLVAIVVDAISGRVIRPAELFSAAELHGYL
jgi:hypothetical protein